MGETQQSESEDGGEDDGGPGGWAGAPRYEPVTCVLLIPLSLCFLICKMGTSQVVPHRVALQVKRERLPSTLEFEVSFSCS